MEEPLDSITLARRIVETVEDKQATDIVLLDVRELTSLTAYFVIATVDTTRQAKAIEDELFEKLGVEQKIRPLGIEGAAGTGAGWTLLDYGDVIAHFFTEEVRQFYRLEELWSKAPIVLKVL